MRAVLEPNRGDRDRYTRLVRFERRVLDNATGVVHRQPKMYVDEIEFLVPVVVERDPSGLVVRVTESSFSTMARDREWPRNLPPSAGDEDLRRSRLEAAWRAAGAPTLTTATPDHSIRAYVALREGQDPVDLAA